MLAILSVAIVTITALYVQDIRAENRREAELDLAADARLRTAEIEASLQAYGREVITLASTPPIPAIRRASVNRGIDPASGDSYEEWRARLSTIFAAFIVGDSAYLQLRYLDASGAEVVRVDNEDGRAVRVAEGEFQDKSGREYFTAVRNLSAGEVYVSPLDLNIEHGRVEEPGVPVVRFATPVFDPDGRLAGVVITSIAPSALLAPLGPQGRVTAYLVDGGGRYLSHPDESRRFGDLTGAGFDLASDVGPEAAAELTSGAGLLTAAGSMFARTPVEFAGLSTANEWWIVNEIALADIPGANITKPIGAAAVLLLVAGVVGYWVARGVSRELQESEGRLRSVVSASPDAIIGADDKGTIVSASARVREIFGWRPEDLVGMPASTLIPERYVSQHRQAMRDAAADGNSGSYHVIRTAARRRDGAEFPAEVSISPGGADSPVQWVAIVRDVTELTRSEERVRQSERDLQALNRQLEQRVRERTGELEVANRELEAFSYSVSHDLRAPLRAVDGFTQAVLADYGDALDDEGRRLLGRVRNASRHMSELIDDLLELARVTTVDLHREPVDLTAIARGVAAELLEDSDGRDIDVAVEDGLHAVGDPHLVRVLLRCLLDNAFKFTRLSRQARIQVGEARLDGRACFFVRDNGAGFDMRYVHRLFQPFQRLHTADEFDGTGIGLATVKRIVNRHGGDAWAEGEEGEGATMSFTLRGADDV